MELAVVDRGSNPSTTVASGMGKRHNFSVLEFSRNTESNRSIDIYQEIYYMELAHVIMECDRFLYVTGPKICSWQTGDPEELMGEFQGPENQESRA